MASLYVPSRTGITSGNGYKLYFYQTGTTTPIDTYSQSDLAIGHVHVSALHANFIVHDGQGTATDYAALMAEVQRRVLAMSGVRLRPEIEWWGPGDLPEAWR